MVWSYPPTQKAKEHKETFGGDEYAYLLDFGDGLMGICIHPTHQIVHTKYVHFVLYWLYLNKSDFFKLLKSHSWNRKAWIWTQAVQL